MQPQDILVDVSLHELSPFYIRSYRCHKYLQRELIAKKPLFPPICGHYYPTMPALCKYFHTLLIIKPVLFAKSCLAFFTV